MTEDIDVLIAFPIEVLRGGNIAVMAWCQKCKQWNFHGMSGDATARKKDMEHRAGHCKCQGYYLQLVRKKDIERIVKHATERV